MERRRITAVCAALVLFAATAFAAKGDSEEMRSDLWLEARVVTAYTLNRHLNPFDLDVDVENGVARVGGTVDSDVERDLAVEIAKGVEGIREVREEIRIEPGAKAGERREPAFFRAVEDATITAMVKSRLLWNRNTDGLDIDVTTRKGIVSLKGAVASDAQADLAVQLAKNTTGVQGVKSRLDVAPGAGKAKEQGALESMGAKASDAWITTKVKSMLLFSKDTQGAEIDVSTRDHVVTLQGTVVSQSQKEQVLRMVGDMAGVREIRANLTVDKG